MKAGQGKADTLPSYRLSGDGLGAGASLGNSALWVNTKTTGAIERIFFNQFGVCVVGAITIRYAVAGSRGTSDRASGDARASARVFVPLQLETPGEFEIHPAFQRHSFVLAGSWHVAETTFVPLGSLEHGRGDLPLVYQHIEIKNGADTPNTVRATAFARVRGELDADVKAAFDGALGALVAWNESRPDAVRAFGCTLGDIRYATTSDFGSAYDPLRAPPLVNSTKRGGDVLACIQADLNLEPGERASFAFVTGIYDSREAAIVGFRKRPDAEDALRDTDRYLKDTLRIGEVLTPDSQINLGALWSKVNMRRVMALYPHGLAFTNEPSVSSNVVCRDAAWFAYGSDHFMPAVSRGLIDKFAALQYPDGKLPEYFNAVTGMREDYGLNINDDTPLFILAVNHHARSTGDLEWLRGIYPAVALAAKYIISQMDARDLVVCTSTDPRGNVWGIAGWRNVIPNYCSNGAVTEINAECAAALRAAAHLVENLGGAAKDVEQFRTASQRIRKAMDSHLRNPVSGLYYLNIDTDGEKHSDVTGDELFPVMFRVCDEDTGYRIISRLNSKDFWTSAGLRTASRDDPLYEPSGSAGLLGGVWPGLTWWYAFAAARYHPEFMVRALRSSFEHYAASPATFNTVPGEFSEWFDGESLVNRGLRLSPWEPPRFLWAAIEGVCGLSVRPGNAVIEPLIPASWRWIGLRRLPYHGHELSYFATRQHGGIRVYATAEVECREELQCFEEDVTDKLVVMSDAAAAIALKRPGELLVLMGNISTQTTTAPVDVSGLIDRETRYHQRIYNSERDEWVHKTDIYGLDIGPIAVSIEVHGFRLIEFRAL